MCQKDTPIIILVAPQLPENIGMVARAMANFGLYQLRLVNPREAFPSPKAYAAASKADCVIDQAVLFPTLAEAVADLHYVYATTARERYNYKPVRAPIEAIQTLRPLVKQGKKTGILFGRERFGLSNDEISLADEIITFPVNVSFSSLNLAQSVLLMAYEWRKSGLATAEQTNFTGPVFEQASKDDLYGLFSHLETALDSRGYFRSQTRKEVMMRNLRDVLTRAHFSPAEIRLLRGMIASFDRFSPEVPKGTGCLQGRSSLQNKNLNK